MTRKRDFTTFYIIGLCALILGAFGLGVAIEILKFVALIKWVFG